MFARLPARVTRPVAGLLSGGAMVFGSRVTAAERDDVKLVLERFMELMNSNDSRAAQDLFCARARPQMTSRDTMQRALVDGYVGLEIDSMNMKIGVNTDPNEPQGITAEVVGTITYSDGYRGNFRSILEKEDGRWMLAMVTITLPPDKQAKHAGKP